MHGKNAEMKWDWKKKKNKFLKNGKSVTVFNNSSNSFCAKKRKIAQRQNRCSILQCTNEYIYI